MNLQTKLVTVFLLLSILPIVIVGYLAYDNSRDALEAATLDRLVQTNRLKSDELTRWIDNNEATIEALAQRPLVRQYTSAMLTESPDDAASTTIMARLQRDHLLPALSEQGGFLTLSILAPDDGQIVLSTNASMHGKYRESERYFIEGRSQTVTQNPRYSLADGGVVMVVGTPIVDDDGALVAVLAGQIDFTEMADIVSREQSRSATEETYLVNAHHFIMTESRFDPDSAFAMVLHTAGVDDCLEQNDDVGYYDDYRGVAVVGAYEWIDAHDFCILTEIDQQEAFGPVYELRDTTVQIAAAVALSFALIGLLFASTINNPLKRVAAGARAIGSGNLDHRIQVSSRDEIGDLAHAFNEMADSLHRSMQATAHGQDLMLALSEAAGSVQRARTAEDVYRLIGDEISRLGFHSMIFMVNQDQTELEVVYHTFDTPALKAAEEAAGVTARGWRFELASDSVFGRMLQERSAFFPKTHEDGILSMIPGHVRTRFASIVDELELSRAIYAPLTLDDDVIGILLVSGSDLSGADMRAITTFANQAAIALENTRLYEAVQRYAENLEQRVAGRTADLQQEKQLSEDIVNSLPGIFLMYNDQGELVRWNDQFERRSGYSAEELASIPVIKFADRQQVSAAAQQMQTIYEEGRGESEFNIVAKDGTSTPYFFSSLRITLDENLYVIGVGIDITERKRAEVALKESEARFRDLYNQTPIGLMRSRLDGTVLEANPAAVAMLGYPDRDTLLTVKTPSLYVDLADREALTARLMAGEDVTDFETRVRRYDGKHIWVRINVRVRHGAENQPSFMEVAAQDITERKQAEIALRESEERFRQVFVQGPLGMAFVGLDYRLEDVNPRFCDIVGYSRDELTERTFADITHPDDIDADVELAEQLIAGDIQHYTLEKRYIRKDGTPVWIELTGAVVRDDDNEPLYALAMIEDIQERKAAEEQLAQSMAELERSNEELEQFAYVASHDLQEPLRMVTSYLQLLERRYKGQLDDSADTFIHYAIDGAARMKRLIQDLLVYSRVDRYGKPPEPVSARSIVEQALGNLQAAIEESGACITYDDLPDVRGDETQLVMLFQNLIGNAIKFRGVEAPQIRIAAERDGARWRFALSDNGIGIDPEYFDRIFIIFQRLHSSQEYRGTGIGLAVCKKIIDRHGGDIWVESELGDGTTFYFTLAAQEQLTHE